MKKNNKKRKRLHFNRGSLSEKIEYCINNIITNPNDERSKPVPFKQYYSEKKGTMVSEGITISELAQNIFPNFNFLSYEKQFLYKHNIHSRIGYLRREFLMPIFHITGTDGYMYAHCKEHWEMVLADEKFKKEKRDSIITKNIEIYTTASKTVESYEEIQEIPVKERLSKIKEDFSKFAN